MFKKLSMNKNIARLRILLLILTFTFPVFATANGQASGLIQAARQGDNEVVGQLLASGIDPNTKKRNGSSPLGAAFQNRKISTMELLLRNGASADTVLPIGWNLLSSSAISNRLDALKILLKYGANPNIRNKSGRRTPLMFACLSKSENIDVLQALLHAGADPNLEDHLGSTALNISINRSRKKYIQVLIKNEADINHVNKSGYTALGVAIAMRRTSVAMSASEIVKFLISYKADVNLGGRLTTPLVLAINRNKPYLVPLLLKAGADPNQDGALVHAVRFKLNSVVDLLLEAGADINYQNSSEMTALHITAGAGDLDLVKRLVEAGTDMELKDLRGETALQWAQKRKHTQVIEYLIGVV